VIGDNGSGKRAQYEVGAQLVAARDSFPFAFVIMLGDNLYGSQAPSDFVDKFERLYAPLLQAEASPSSLPATSTSIRARCRNRASPTSSKGPAGSYARAG
jgi:hypothetical protein